MSRRKPIPRPPHGFTLIEVLVSLLILAVLAGTCWKGVDAISSARTIADEHLQHTLRLQSVVTQVEADLGQAVSMGVVDPLIVDGSHLRITRRGTGGVQVVVWFLKNGTLLRWASPSATTVGDLQKYSLTSFQLEGNEPGTLKALVGVDRMQLYCYVGGSLANCQSTRTTVSSTSTGTGALTSTGQIQPLPEAVRFQLGMAEGSGYQGTVTREVPVELQ